MSKENGKVTVVLTVPALGTQVAGTMTLSDIMAQKAIASQPAAAGN